MKLCSKAENLDVALMRTIKWKVCHSQSVMKTEPYENDLLTKERRFKQFMQQETN